ncbi:ATP-binding protein [Sulfurovum sp. XGS-02]|uniref:AAA family ATPase n=1 Tax=Sulfurovum sp. XGS-02 TaxID=2925411 RepID=UPI0020676CE6|nr:AAA family ATPase [Sulfurovum sp. XGS-02]UPT76679.1 ATP-binding protein [Sulfurovum sp. XGS-02]
MELVYLWVKEYKNIKEEGFNFSSPYVYTYSESTKEITHEDNPGNYSKLFSKNIRISAIVGKNGSGKSSIFEVIAKLQVGDIDRYIDNGIVCILKNGDEEIIFSNLEVEDRTVHTLDTLKTHISTIYNSSSFSNGYFDNYIEEFIAPVLQRFIKSGTGHGDSNVANENLKVQTLLNMVLNSNRYFGNNPSSSGYRQQDAFFIKEMRNNFNFAKTFSILEFYKDYKTFIPFKIQNEPTVTLLIASNSTANSIGWNTTFLEKAQKFFQIPEFYTSEDGEEYMQSIRPEEYAEALDNFLTTLKLYVNESCTASEEIELSMEDAIELMIKYKELYLYNRNNQDQFFEIYFRSLSSGEENFLLNFYLLLNAVFSFRPKRGDVKNIIILLDEIENNLHPRWQKSIFDSVLRFFIHVHKNILSRYGADYKFHIIFASHSPFLLSDIAKENILFLDKDDDGYCKVVDGLKNINQTFGADIHTILTDSFFMDEGLSGDFSQSAIQAILTFYDKVKKEESAKKPNYDDLRKEYGANQKMFEYILLSMGDDYIKQILDNHIIEIELILFDKDIAKANKISRLKNEINQLEEMQ